MQVNVDARDLRSRWRWWSHGWLQCLPELKALARKASSTSLTFLHPCHGHLFPPAIPQQLCLCGAIYTARKSILGEESSDCDGTVQLSSCSGTSSYYRAPRHRETRSETPMVRHRRHCTSSSNPRPDTACRTPRLGAEASKVENKEAK